MPAPKKASAQRKSGKKPISKVLTDNGNLLKRKRASKRN